MRKRFTVSKNHLEMSESQWSKLNNEYHNGYFGGNNLDDPLAILELAANKIIPNSKPWLDWGCGDGKLSDLLQKQGINLLKYDKYQNKKSLNLVSDQEVNEEKYDLVVSTSVFEHVRSHRIA